MYIQQQCVLSFNEIIKLQPKTKIEIILAELDFTNILNELNIIDGTNVAIDSTSIHSFEKAKPKSKLINDKKSSDWGVKKAKVVALLSCIALVAGTIAVNQLSNDLKSIA